MLTQQIVIDQLKFGLMFINCNYNIIIKFDEEMSHIAYVKELPHGQGIEMVFSITKMQLNDYAIPWKVAIAHELIHIKQKMRGDTKVIDNRYYWKGDDETSRITHAMYYLINLRIADYYYELPWEMEAFQGQERLASEIEEFRFAFA